MAVNDDLQDAAIGHAVDLQRYSTWLVQRIIGLLNRTDSDLFSRLTAGLATMPAESFTVERLESLLFSVRQLNLQAYEQIGRELTRELMDFAAYEANYQLQLFQSTIPAQVVATVGVAAVNVQQVEAAVLSRPFQGRLLREWSKSIETDRMTRIRDAIRIGYVEGQTVDQIVRRVRGTRARGYADGIIEIDRRNAQSVVRTAVSHTAATARDAFYEENEDLIKALKWTATLDTRTTPICQVRDGLEYDPKTHRPMGHSVPWLGGPGKAHWNCFPAGTLVTTSTPIRAVYKRFFDGDLIIIRTAGGKAVSCTPNHPILTARGWIAAELMDESDQVVCDGGRQWVGLVDDDGDDVPARIEDVAESFLATRGVFSVEVPTAAPDFHGDGGGSDVAVVGANRGLFIALQAGMAEHRQKLGLVNGDTLAAIAVACNGVLGALFNGAPAAFGSLIRGGGQAFDLIACKASHACSLLVSSIARLHACASQMTSNHRGRGLKMCSDACYPDASVEHVEDLLIWERNETTRSAAAMLSKDARNHLVRDAVAGRNVFCRLSGIESREDRSGVESAHIPANLHAPALENGGDRDVCESELASKIITGATGPVFLDDVVSVSRRRFSGHVFNLETELGAYTANGIISHNCRSVSVPVLKSWRELGIPIDEMPASTRASMDGQVPEDMDYGTWLQKQSAARQDEIVGPQRGALMRKGDLPFDKLFDSRGQYLSLDQLRERDAAAFRRAGLE